MYRRPKQEEFFPCRYYVKNYININFSCQEDSKPRTIAWELWVIAIQRRRCFWLGGDLNLQGTGGERGEMNGNQLCFHAKCSPVQSLPPISFVTTPTVEGLYTPQFLTLLLYARFTVQQNSFQDKNNTMFSTLYQINFKRSFYHIDNPKK